MSSQTHQKKTAQHPNSPAAGPSEDYNGYSSQYYVKDHLLPKDHPAANHQVKQSQPDEDKMRMNEYMGIQGHRSDSLEYLQRQDKKGGYPQDTSPQHSLSKNLHDSNGSHKFNSSLEAIPSDIKHNIKDKVQLPTFGDDQLNMMVAQQQNNSPDHKKSNVSKIEQLLEQHKKRKAQQKFNELKNETDCVSPISEKFVPSRDSDRIPYALAKEQDLFVNIIEGEWSVPAGIPTSSGHSRERGSFGAHSFGVEHIKPGSNTGGQTERKGLIDVMSDHNSNAGETGRFKGSPRWNEVDVEKQESERKEFEAQNSSQTYSTSDRKSNITSSRNTSQDGLSPKGKGQANVPKISKNSQKIFRNSQRAKEDEKMVQDLLATKIRQISNAETMESAGLQRIPEENESMDKSKQSNNGSPKSKKRVSQTLETEEDKIRSNWSLAAEGLANDTLSLPKIKTISDTQSFRFTTGDESPKKQTTKRTFESYDPYNASTSSSYVSSPKNLKGTTIIEHKKPSVLDANLFLKKGSNNDRTDSPSRKEITEIAKSPKQIYLKVVDNTKDSGESPRKSAKSQRESVTPEPRKSAKNSKAYTDITPEELAKYDEVQRLEIIKNNLQELQRANLLAQLHALRLSNSKSLDSPTSPKTPPQDWNLYAEEINSGASKTRTTRQNRQKTLQAAKSVSPQRMEKVNITVESFCNSAQLREHLSSQTEGDEDIKNIWRHENGLRKSWAEDNMYERNQKWLMVKKYKMDQINESLSWEEMKDCSFKPTFFTKNSYSLVASPQRSHTEASQSNYNSLTDRLPIESIRNNDLGAIVSERIGSERKSLYRDRRNKDSYSGLFDLKKNYNLYKGDSVSVKKNETVNAMIYQASGMRRKDFAY